MATEPPDNPPPPGDSRWDASVVVGDGETVLVRAMGPSDAPALSEFHRRQTPDAIYRRFFSPKPELSPAELRHFTEVDMVDRAALCVESHGEFIAWASYERWPGRDDADTSFMVDEGQRGKGIATLLLEHLAAIAKSHGIERFTAEVLADNRPMLAVFARAGWPLERKYDSGVIEVDFAIADTHDFLDSLGRREQRADSRAMARLLLPRSIAVVGASDRPGTVGDVLWRNVTNSAKVPVYAVNPHRATINRTGADGVDQPERAWATVTAIPDDISLAIIAVPAAALAATIDDCIAARVRGAVVATSIDSVGDGAPGAGVDIEAMVAKARSNGMRIIGPSSMGVATSRPEIGLEASLVPVDLPEGTVAVSMQSGSLGSSVLRLAQQLHLGLSWFVSLGDRSDVSGNDLLQFWEDDESTNVIAMYNESLGNARRFARIARRVSLRRPIVAVRTGAAAIGPSGGALYQHSGLIEVPTVASMLDTARVLATQPILRGRRIAVISNSRSPSTLAHAAIEAAGLLPVEPPLPLDWRATSTDYEAAIVAAIADDDVDGVMIIHAPPIHQAVGAPVDAIDAAAAGSAKPVTAILLGAFDGPIKPGSSVPGFSFPEPAAAVLGRSYAYGHWLDSESSASPITLDDIDADGVNVTLAAAMISGRPVLDAVETAHVLTAYGIATPTTQFVPADQAVATADRIGYPVAIKARHRHVGRSVHAGVALDLTDAGDVAASVEAMRSSLGAHADSVIVQSMTPPGLDLGIRISIDDNLGPLVSVGLGGTQADLLADEAARLAPLSVESALALIGGSRAGAALAGAGIGSAHLVDVLVRVAQLAADHHELCSVELNPVIATPSTCVVTDALLRIGSSDHVDAAPRAL